MDFELIDYEARYKPALMDISLPWLKEHDILEAADMEQLEHPEQVLERGGRVLLARAGEEIVGMLMLELFGNGIAELFKFGIKESHRNCGIGAALLQKAVNTAIELGQTRLVLTSHHSLIAALHLYERFGFRHEVHDNIAFELSDVCMVKDL